MTPTTALAMLIAAVLVWKFQLRIVCWTVGVPLLLTGRLLVRVPWWPMRWLGAHSVLAGIDIVLWVNEWIARGQEPQP